MATKKKTPKKRKSRTRALPGDAPIIVGGGGSTFIWIKKELDPQLVRPDDVPGSAPQPHTPALYYCFVCRGGGNNGNVSRIVVDDGTAAQPNPDPPRNIHNRKHAVEFS